MTISTRSDADLVAMAYERIGNLEESLDEIRDLAVALTMMADGLHKPASGAVFKVAEIIITRAEEIEEERGEIWHALHPRRREPGWTGRDD